MPFCAKCGAKLATEDAAFCSKCGATTGKATMDVLDTISDDLRTAGREIEAGLRTAGQEIDKAFRELRDEFSERTGLFCVKCGARNPRDAMFCYSCGKEIPHTA